MTRTPGRIVVRYRFGPPLTRFLPLILVTSWATQRGSADTFLVGVWIAAFVLVLWDCMVVRLTADANGVRVTNWLPRRYAWQDINAISLISSGSRRKRVEVLLNDGGSVKPWVGREGGYDIGGYSRGQLERIVERLSRMRQQALGLPDPPELATALASAELGDPRPMDDLLASNRIDHAVYEDRLHELADAGTVDLEALRMKRREAPPR